MGELTGEQLPLASFFLRRPRYKEHESPCLTQRKKRKRNDHDDSGAELNSKKVRESQIVKQQSARRPLSSPKRTNMVSKKSLKDGGVVVERTPDAVAGRNMPRPSLLSKFSSNDASSPAGGLPTSAKFVFTHLPTPGSSVPRPRHKPHALQTNLQPITPMRTRTHLPELSKATQRPTNLRSPESEDTIPGLDLHKAESPQPCETRGIIDHDGQVGQTPESSPERITTLPMSPISSLRTRLASRSDSPPNKKLPAPSFTPQARKPTKAAILSPVRYVPSSQSQYLYLSPVRPRSPAPSRDEEITGEIVQSSQSQRELGDTKYESLLLSETRSRVDVSEIQSSVDRTPTRKSFTRTPHDDVDLHDDSAAHLISSPSQSDPQSTYPETGVSPVSILPTLRLIPVPESNECFTGLPTELRCARETFAEEGEELLSGGGPIEAKQTATEGDDSVTEPESESEVFRVLQSIRRRKEGSGRHSDQVPCHATHHPRSSLDKRIQAVVERMDAEPSSDSDDYEHAGAALSIPSSDVSSLPWDLSITESFVDALPEPVKAFVEMFETEGSDVGSEV